MPLISRRKITKARLETAEQRYLRNDREEVEDLTRRLLDLIDGRPDGDLVIEEPDSIYANVQYVDWLKDVIKVADKLLLKRLLLEGRG